MSIQDGNGGRAQDAVRAHADRILELTERGAITYVFGGADTVAPALRDVYAEIYQQHTGVSAAEGVAWLEEQRAAKSLPGRYLGGALMTDQPESRGNTWPFRV